MSTSKDTVYYMELQPGDKVQVRDQWLDQFGQWQFYTFPGGTKGVVSDGVRARRQIGATHQTSLEEVPGSRTSQQAIDQPQRERIAYEELQPGDIIQEGDEWQHESGRWKPFVLLDGFCERVRHTQRARRPYSITVLEKYRLVPSTTGNLIDDIHRVIGERDEARAERDRLKGLIDDLLDVPTARQVQDMLRTWATELDWSADCFDSLGREQIESIQKTLIAVMERIETMIHPEGGDTDGK